MAAAAHTLRIVLIAALAIGLTVLHLPLGTFRLRAAATDSCCAGAAADPCAVEVEHPSALASATPQPDEDCCQEGCTCACCMVHAALSPARAAPAVVQRALCAPSRQLRSRARFEPSVFRPPRAA